MVGHSVDTVRLRRWLDVLDMNCFGSFVVGAYDLDLPLCELLGFPLIVEQIGFVCRSIKQNILSARLHARDNTVLGVLSAVPLHHHIVGASLCAVPVCDFAGEGLIFLGSYTDAQEHERCDETDGKSCHLLSPVRRLDGEVE